MRAAALLLCVLLAWPARAEFAGAGSVCRSAIAAAERGTMIPDRLLAAIAVIESGRRNPSTGTVSPWPWTINAEGVGHLYDSKAEAIAAVESLRARGVRSIDVGCMQVNLMHHADAFSSLEEAFDPAANARYAARFLSQLYQQSGTWPRATAGYHSLTPEIGDDYARKVLAVWPREREMPTEPLAAPPRAFAALPVALNSSGGMTARILPMPGASAMSAVPTGRGLDDYRAMPTRMALPMGLMRRF